MKIAVYGGSFNPPHLGHVHALSQAQKEIKPGKTLVIPAHIPPHKAANGELASAEDRLEMCRLAFGELPDTEISGIEMEREGKSYTADTMEQLRSAYPKDELCFIMGTDMASTFTSWKQPERIAANCSLWAFSRDENDDAVLKEAAAKIKDALHKELHIIPAPALPMSSSMVRARLKLREGRQYLPENVYAYIISHRLYGSRPEFEWLRLQAYSMLKAKRIPHVKGCEQEAVRLAARWGENVEEAAVAGILHDITKKLELKDQLEICYKYDVELDELEKENEKLLHSKTGAEIARDRFGVSDAVYTAIKWHTTGKANMTLLEKIIYMADYIEPTRNFEGLEELRSLAYTDLDKAMLLGERMSLEDVTSRGNVPHPKSLEAVQYFTEVTQG